MHRAFRVSTGLCAVLILVVLLPGCRQGTFIGNRYNNFRAYYNTFYNARRAFDVGEEAIERSERQIDRSRFISVFPATQPGAPTSGGQFEQAIEKSADLLRERPDSKWADDALLLIGKAYFYQNNVVGAEAKFRETILAALERDQPELVDESRFWLGRTLVAGERYDEAVSILQEGLARPGIETKWSSKLYLALGELYVQQRKWSDAAAALRLGIPTTEQNDLSGRAQFLLGQVLEADGRYAEAAEAYREVGRHRPIYELSYASKLSEALVLGVDAGDTEFALEQIRRMRRDDKNFQNRAEVELAYARLLAAANRPSDAQERFEMLLYDEDFRSNNVRGEVYYRYAEYFRDDANNYVRAAAYFDTAATNVRIEPGREELVTRVALRDVRRNADVYRTYASIASELAEADSLLYLGSLSSEQFREAIASIERQRLIQWEEDQRLLAARRAEQGFGNTPITRTGEFPAESDGSRAGLGGDPGSTGIEVGFLNYRDPARTQDAMLAFERIWGDRPLAPNWRRIQALQSAVIAGRGPEEGGDQGLNGQGASTGPTPLDISNVPRTEEAQARLRGDRAELRYELGNVFFLSLAKPDSAAHWYRLVIGDDVGLPVVTRAKYALAEVLGIQGENSEAEELYRQVADEDPRSPQAAQARERLGLPPLEESTIVNTHELAEEAYSRAYQQWRQRAYEGALGQMLALGARASDDDVSPRALLASAVIFSEWARDVGMDLERGIPGELVPEQLLDEAQEFPQGSPVPSSEVPALPLEPGEESLDSAADEMETDPDMMGLTPTPQIKPTVNELPETAIADLASESPDGQDDALANDSLALSLHDSEPSHVDSLKIPSTTFTSFDSAADEIIPLDSLTESLEGANADTTEVASSQEALEEDFGPYLKLVDLYQIIESRYAGTQYAQRAHALRQGLLRGYGDGIAGDDPSVGESGVNEPEEPELDGDYGVRGTVPLNPEIGGFTWKVASVPSSLAAISMLRNFSDGGFRAGASETQNNGRAVYSLLIGQFASEEDAEAARSLLPATGVGRDLVVVSMDGMTLLAIEDLEALTPPE